MSGEPIEHEEQQAIRVTVNGQTHDLRVESRLLLVDLLRHTLGLTGTHVGCEHGVCGCCTIIMDGAAVRACLLLAPQVNGSELLTVEGLEQAGRLDLVQEAFSAAHGFQCGFCTPGFIMATVAYLRERSQSQDAGGTVPSRAEIREVLSGNLCRCTGYQAIIDAVGLAATRALEGGVAGYVPKNDEAGADLA